MDVMPSPLNRVAVPRSPESLRRRQRDRLSPRRAFANSSRPVDTAFALEIGGSSDSNIALTSPSKPKGTVNRLDTARLRPLQDGLRKENSMNKKREREQERERGGDSKYEATSEGGTGREGRHFTVSNVGNNGRIYLHPTIRPANQRYAQPPAAFPMTPPSTAGIDVLVSLHEEGETPSWTPAPSQSPSIPQGKQHGDYFLGTPPRLPLHSRHKRAHSCSTVNEHGSVRGPDAGVSKVVIERPTTEARMDQPFVGSPTLEVPIPSYKLGTPRFSFRGTPFFRGSIYSSADEIRSSNYTREDASHRDGSSHTHSRIHSRRHSDASTLPYYPHIVQSNSYTSSPIPPAGFVGRSTTINPEIFDSLTFKPACDDPSVVRYTVDGSIRAATPSRLVAEITSPTFVDYHLLSDFFLTFRAYLNPADLLYMLIARLKWAFSRDDGPGMVVRVRTFVAVRHWILNYFPDDYVVDYDLRKSFCELLNSFVGELSNDPSQSTVSLKILGELKKCWRRVCALYWDNAEFDPDLEPDAPIYPGGPAGSRNSSLNSDPGETLPATAPRLDVAIQSDFIEHEAPIEGASIGFCEVSRDCYTGPVAIEGSSEIQTQTPHARPLSPTSIMSEDVISCSLPTRARLAGVPCPSVSRPVPARVIFDPAQPVATTPKALIGKRVRPAHSHKRSGSGSFSDSCRDTATQPRGQNGTHKRTDSPPSILYSGSLVRGNLFPPGQATVDIIAPGTPANSSSPTPPFHRASTHQCDPSAMSGPGMKRLLRSVRRALSNRSGSAANSSPTQGSFPNIPPLGVRGATVNRLPGTAIVPQARPRHLAPMRIDILGAEVAEDFKNAVQEGAEIDAEQRESERDSVHDAQTLQRDATLESTRSLNPIAPLSALTSGSKSIVIVDDTVELQLPVSNAVDTFTDPFMHPSGGPTPPTTPPDVVARTPRRSSLLLGEHTRHDSVSHELVPPLLSDAIDSRPCTNDERTPSYRLYRQPSLRSRAFSASQRSLSLRHYASYQSGFNRHRSERSFDATTISELEGPERQPPSVPPRRILRRRPGGDLKAVINVGDLNIQTLRRPMSTGSLATFTESVRGSFLESMDHGDYDQPISNVQTFSVGALAERPQKAHVSLFSTHSSQPVMRPSFEKEAQMLAQIPDDADDDGGVESALLKLEGKYERRSGTSTDGAVLDIAGAHNSFGPTQNDANVLHEGEEKRKNRQGNIIQAIATSLPIQSNTQEDDEELQPTAYNYDETPTTSSRSPRLVESYNSIPLLDRCTPDGSMVRTRDWSEHSILRGPSEERQHGEHTPVSSHRSSFDFIYKTDVMEEVRPDQVHSNHQSKDNSFLESDSENRSDLSSELSLEVISRTEYTEHDSTSTHTFPPIRRGTVMKEIALSSHPLRHSPSPPITLQQALQLTPNAATTPQVYKEQRTQVHTQQFPRPNPTQKRHVLDFDANRIASTSTNALIAHSLPEVSRKTAVHLPFTLAFDSQVLAQQFTLIEKDALNEVDWKDLIEMRWKDASADPRSWVEFLRTSEPRGVEVVIARFNLMVKWATSECVLTQDLKERVQCISKFIHIADHCRKYRNFATLTQLTIALTSNEIRRLTQTWAHVPTTDIQTLRQLEILIAPNNNFHSLRAEMEGSSVDQGCIPFLGIYTHDLLVNLDRPNQIASTPIAKHLINFEKYRADAMIVKNLLRLLESSQLYRFLPIEGITERCLWMAALTDSEIFRHGATIQA